jgi:hypothetical protein
MGSDVSAPALRVAPVLHQFVEVPATLLDTTTEQVFSIPPCNETTQVKVRTHVLAAAARARVSSGSTRTQYSPEYYAILRRRGIQEISVLISDLATNQGDPGFPIRTYPIVERVGKVLNSLTDSTSEGNSREILRQIRDSFLNGGWERDRVPEKRQVVSRFLHTVGQLEAVTLKHADECFDMLLDSGFNPVPSITNYGKKQAEVSN